MIESKVYLSLDFQDFSSNHIVPLKRGETGKKVVISLSDGGFPYHIEEGCYAVLTGEKPDGNVLFNHCGIDGDTIVYDVTEQTTAVAGRILSAINLYGPDDALIISAKFRILVDGTVYKDGNIESEPEVSALTHLISDAKTTIDTGKDTIKAGNEAADAANTAAALANQAAASADASVSDANAARDSANAAAEEAGKQAAAAQSAAQDAVSAADSANNGAAAANEAASSAQEQAAAAGSASTAANTAAALANQAKVSSDTAAAAANTAADAAQSQAAAAEEAAGRANAAALGADTARDAANAAADTANQAAAAAQRVVDTVAPDVLQLKQTAAIHENALDNRIKKFYTNNLGGTFIADSDDGAVQNLVVYGKSEQAATTGAQVLSYAAKTETRSGVTFTVHDDGTVTAKGTAEETIWFPLFTQDDFTLKSGRYTLRANFSGKSVGTSRLQLENKDGFYQSENSFTITEDTPITGHLKVYEGESVDFTCKPMLNSGSIAHEWEPYTGGMPSPSPGYPQEIKATANPVMLLVSDNQSCSAAVPYTLNAIPVSSGGNVTIDGQQYIADYVDVENGCIVRNVVAQVWTGEEAFSQLYDRQGVFQIKSEDYGLPITGFTASPTCLLCDTFPPTTRENVVDKLAIGIAIYYTNMICIYPGPDLGTVDAFKAYLSEHPVCFMCKRSTPVFESIPDDQIAGLKSLRTYYGGTNITFATENGVEPAVHFDYACSLENFVEYIKAAQGDDRKFIYDMDERMTDAEYMAAMAYVNSEYAAALTELEG